MRDSQRPLGLTLLCFTLGLLAACSSVKSKPGGTGSGSTPPTVQSATPTQSTGMLAASSSAGIELVFNVEMQASSFEGGALQVLADENPVSGSVRMGDAANHVLFVFNEPMVAGKPYTVQLQGVRSRSDLILAAYETVVFGL